ncbi:SDR family NAD(P)-dependent oxidoreductase [Sphingomonas sp.]|uniref:SDR family NAD(P)-dependent oxidoreductase n=1 Tax=Sphingomonas sp. TaxID=28214 RepID=UPI003AFF8651
MAVITGGASGVGLATIERFVAEGTQFVFCDLPPESAEVLVERLGAVKASAHQRGVRRAAQATASQSPNGWVRTSISCPPMSRTTPNSRRSSMTR